jgi:hypothetical protein
MALHIENLLKIAEKLAEDKRPWDNMSQEIAENCYPVRASFTQKMVLGQEYSSFLMDSMPVNAREELGNTLDAMLRQGGWFQVGTGDEDRDNDPENARALERATMMMRRMINDPRMNFRAATKEADHDYVAFGQPVLSVEENMNRTFPYVRAWHPGDCCWTLDDDGEINSFYRKFDMPVRNIATLIKNGRWNGKLPLQIEMKLEKEPNTRVRLCHVLMKTEELYGSDGQKMRMFRGAPYVSLYVDPDTKEALHERGEPMCAYLTPRWRSFSGTTYGFSPAGLNSLPDQRMLQQLAMIILEQGEKALDPPLIGSQEVFTRDMNFFAGGFTYVDMPDDRSLQDVMTTLEVGKGIEAGLELKQDLRATIMDAWLLNKLYLPRLGDMRELEVATRNEEFRRAALPFFQPVESDYHPKLLGKIFDRAVLMGLIPKEMFPSALSGQDIRWSFTTPLNEVDGLKVFDAYNRAIQSIAAGSQVDESVGMLFNMKQAAIDAVRGGGAKASWIYSGKELEGKMAEADQAQQLQQANNVINQTALTTANVAAATQSADAAGLGG